MSKEICLSQGKVAIVDDDLYNYYNQWIWSAFFDGHNWYAVRQKGKRPFRKQVKMHRDIMNAPEGIKIDHKNGNGLDNRRENLRFCTQSQNAMNSKIPKSNKTGYKGVSYIKRDRIYQAHIKANGKAINLGSFHDPVEAAKVYDEAAIKYFGEFAKTNF